MSNEALSDSALNSPVELMATQSSTASAAKVVEADLTSKGPELRHDSAGTLDKGPPGATDP